MIFAEAIEFSRKFSSYHPKIFKDFFELGICSSNPEDYVVLTDLSLAAESCYNQLEDYLKNHKLKVECTRDYLIILTHI